MTTTQTLITDTQTATPAMQAALFYAPGDIRFEPVAMPTPGPGELVIQIQTALTCGTDLKAFRRGHPVLLKHFPARFGHEGAGIVTAVGEGVTGFMIGDRVVPANSAPCMDCHFCHKAQYNLCESLDLLNGTYADYLKIPAPIVRHNTLTIPAHVPFEAAAFTEPLAVCMRGLDACHLQPGDTVAILGIGAIGLLMAKLAQLQGAKVIALGRNPLKRELAASFAQADAVVDVSRGMDIDAIKSKYTPGGYGFDVVIEAVGQPQTWEQAFRLVRRGGLVNLFGGCESGSTITLETRRLHYDEITLISPFHHTPTHVRRALDWISADRLNPAPLITAEMPMSRLSEAFEQVSSGQAIKIALHPDRP